MIYRVKNWYFVPFGEPVKASSTIIPKISKGKLIKGKLSEGKLPDEVATGDTWPTNHKKLARDPFGGIRKDLVCRAIDENGVSREFRFPESQVGNKTIIIKIP